MTPEPRQAGQPQRDLASIFLVSAGVLAFEVILTRLFALAFWHHFASLLIALALTGLGAAGSLLSLLRPGPGPGRALVPAASALASAGAMPLAFAAAWGVGLEPLSLGWALRHWLELAGICALLLAPFLLAGAHLALILARAPRPQAAYASSLAGSGLGCGLAALCLAWLPPHQALYAAAGLALLGCLAQIGGLSLRARLGLALAALAAAGLVAAFPPGMHFAAFKDRSAALAASGSRVQARAWGLRGVLEVIGGPAFHYAPGLSLTCQQALPGQSGLFLDGDLAGVITRLPDQGPLPGFLDCLLLSLPQQALRPKRVLVLEPGAGLAALSALRAGASQVVLVQENPQVLELLQGPLAGFSGRLLQRTGIKVVQDDPARFVAQPGTGFDLIILGSGVNWGQDQAGGLGVSRLLTVQGLGQLLDRLNPQGALALSGPLGNPPRASLKALLTAAAALRARGGQPGRGLALMRDWLIALILVKPSGFSGQEAEALARAARARSFDLSCLPGLDRGGLDHFHRLQGETLARACALIKAGQERDLVKDYPFDLRPATRDRPYFHHFFRPALLGLILDPRAGAPLAVTDWGLLFVWGGLGAILILAGLGVLLPLVRLRPRPRGLAFFALIGLGYMLAEVTLLAEVIQSLGRPAIAVPLVVGVFLVVSGLGSLLWGGRSPRPFALASAAALPLALLGLRLAPGGEVLSALLLAPAALVMGAPFAAGLNHIAGPGFGPRAWAFGVNGFFSVAGSLAAALICLQAGHSAALGAAVVCYILAGLVARGGR